MSYNDHPTSPSMSSPRRLTNRNTNRYSVTALFSMAAEQDVEVEDDLARGSSSHLSLVPFQSSKDIYSSKASPRSQGKDFRSIQKEFRFGTRCQVFGFKDRTPYSEPDGLG